jgi:hypothetical protein
MKKIAAVLIFAAGFTFHGAASAQTLKPVVPPSERGNISYEREGTHDANNIRTVFFNYGMVGDYPADPINVDLTTFHSMEVPKGTGENYSDGTTPFVLAKIKQRNGFDAYIMETGFRERQATSPITNKTMRFEPRPGYFQVDPAINKGRSVALSSDPRTWPDEWIDKINDPDDPGWSGSWNGYFGKAPAADQESYIVYDDNYYDAWDFYPDSRDNSRRGLGLNVEQRGFQWANPQAGNVIFFHYDITNESTTDYVDNIFFGLYMDSGVGGSGVGVDGIAESDDDNASFDTTAGMNLVYTWDVRGHGQVGKTGYLGYAYLETPGNPRDGVDNDRDGITDEKRDGGPGQKIEGQENIKAAVQTHYDYERFREFLGDIEDRPAYKYGVWFTGDEDVDWVAEFHDTGADGVFGTNDTGELDGMPTAGEPNFDKTDLDESDQIGLTGFRMNRIRGPYEGSPTDQIVFYQDIKRWPSRLYNNFSDPDSAFGIVNVENYNIGFLFASGPFELLAGQRERFSLALGFGSDLRELRSTIRVVQQIYKSNYQFAVPPPMPTVQAYTGDGFVTLTWDDVAERAFDQLLYINDFEGYRVYRSTDPAFLDAKVITTGTGNPLPGNGQPIAQFDLIDKVEGYSGTQISGVSYFLGENTGITHTFTDTTVTNGQLYYYAVTSYDTGSDSLEVFPSENSITVSQTLRGGTILGKNVVMVRPNALAAGYVPATFEDLEHTEGDGFGTINVSVANSDLVPEGHTFEIRFAGSGDITHAESYMFIDVSSGDTLFTTGTVFDGSGAGPSGKGLLPNIYTISAVTIDSVNSKFNEGAAANFRYKSSYVNTLPIGKRRPGYPSDIEMRYNSVNQDTSIGAIGLPAKPAKFKIIALTNDGERQMNFRFYDLNNDGLVNAQGEYVEVLTYDPATPTTPRGTWRIQMDTAKQNLGGNIISPGDGDVFKLDINKPFSSEDVFTFISRASRIDAAKAKEENQKPYVVPNPYVGAASFEPQRFAVSGRGERRIEFRGLPQECTIRIFTINGELVQTLRHEGSNNEGFEAWDLRTRDNLEVAPGLYIFHVESGYLDEFIGKFAIIK